MVSLCLRGLTLNEIPSTFQKHASYLRFTEDSKIAQSHMGEDPMRISNTKWMYGVALLIEMIFDSKHLNKKPE